jgi:hypothetical protein
MPTRTITASGTCASSVSDPNNFLFSVNPPFCGKPGFSVGGPAFNSRRLVKGRRFPVSPQALCRAFRPSHKSNVSLRRLLFVWEAREGRRFPAGPQASCRAFRPSHKKAMFSLRRLLFVWEAREGRRFPVNPWRLVGPSGPPTKARRPRKSISSARIDHTVAHGRERPGPPARIRALNSLDPRQDAAARPLAEPTA